MKERKRERAEGEGGGREWTERAAGLGMNEGMGRAEGGGVHEERKEARKGTTVDEATSARTEKKRSARGGRDAAAAAGAGAAAAAAATAAAAEYTTRPSRVLGGSVCRVAWPIVCKGSRSSSKEPAEEEEEGSEAN